MTHEQDSECSGQWQCPACGERLRPAAGVLACAHGHSFDVAREGYVNLLLRRRQLAPTVGDAPEMLQARRRLFDAGLYAPLLARVNALAAEVLAGETAVSLLDAGCGEGSYLGRLQAHLAMQQRACGLGVDIAKAAVKLAARRYAACRFAVADVTQRIPVPDAALHLVLNAFAPRNPAEFARVLRPGGWLLLVLPADAHLAALRQRFGLLDVEPDKETHVAAQLAGQFAPARREPLAFPLRLGGTQLRDLVQMTPSARHLAPAALAALADEPETAAEAAFVLNLWQKRA